MDDTIYSRLLTTLPASIVENGEDLSGARGWTGGSGKTEKALGEQDALSSPARRGAGGGPRSSQAQ